MNPLARDERYLPVSEVFGPTFQGEGPHAGRRCFFVRTGLCNLHCHWCDTPFTWDDRRYDLEQENPWTHRDAITDRLRALGATPGQVVVLSGGEPLIHHHRLEALVRGSAFVWHVESNGTIPPPAWWPKAIAHTTVSPKVAQEDDPWKKRIKASSLMAWAELGVRASFKFVCRNESDLADVDRLTDALDLHPARVWVMPEGVTVDAVLDTQRALAPAVLARGYNLTTRLHTLLWHDERGR